MSHRMVQQVKKPQPTKLKKRYSYSLIVVTLSILALCFVGIIITRVLGVCAITITGIPTDSYRATTNFCVGLGFEQYALLLVSGLFGFGGPMHYMFFYLPFYKAFPEVVTFKRRRNIHYMLTALGMALVSIILIVSVPVDDRLSVFAACRVILKLFMFIYVPLKWRKDIKQRDRNFFLTQLEHSVI